MHKVFVFGTLKRGFPLHDEGLRGATCLGAYRTVEPYPLVVAGPWYAPMMVDEAGRGRRVRGELYEVSEDELAALDALESLNKPGSDRVTVEVKALETGTVLAAQAYVKAPGLVEPVHSGYLDDYQDRRFVHPSRRPKPG